jgi:hypothetical protein
MPKGFPDLYCGEPKEKLTFPVKSENPCTPTEAGGEIKTITVDGKLNSMLPNKLVSITDN